jgi:hypothetical protein
MVDSDPAIAVVVVNYNSAKYVDEFCRSLRDVSEPCWRLIVVDSGSMDGSIDAIERAFPDGTYIRAGDNIGFAAGCNRAIDECIASGAKQMLFLNNDVRLTPGFLAALVRASTDKTIVVPKILYADDPSLISTHAGGFDWTLGVFRDTLGGKLDGPFANQARDGLDTASFCCALVPVRAFVDAGKLDERFFMYYEETDFIRRAQANGYSVRYEPSSVIYHHESGASGGGWMTPFKQYYSTRNRPYLVRKHSASRLRYGWFTLYFLTTRIATAARMAYRREWRLLRAMALGVRDYYLGRMGRTMQVNDL